MSTILGYLQTSITTAWNLLNNNLVPGISCNTCL